MPCIGVIGGKFENGLQGIINPELEEKKDNFTHLTIPPQLLNWRR